MTHTEALKRPRWVLQTTPASAAAYGALFTVLAIVWGVLLGPDFTWWQWPPLLGMGFSAVQHLLTWRWLRAHPGAVTHKGSQS